MGYVKINEQSLSGLADAIRRKNGTQTTYHPSEFETAIDAIPSQDNTVLNSLIDRSITNIESTASIVGRSICSNCTQLTNVVFARATRVREYAFESCIRITNIEIPNATILYAASFYNTSALKHIFLRSVTSLQAQAFANDTRLTTIVMGKRATLGNVNAVHYCPAIFYVQPEDLSWYSTATNWSTLYADNLVKSVEELSGDDLLWYQEQLAKYPIEEAS